MTTSPNTTPSACATALNPLLASDRIVFRKSLDHLQDALKADWQVFLRRKMLDTPETLELGHQAAEAWAACLEALREVRDMDAAHADLRAAAVELIQTTPGFYPHTSELGDCQLALRPLAERHKLDDIGLYDLLHEAYLLTGATSLFFNHPYVSNTFSSSADADLSGFPARLRSYAFVDFWAYLWCRFGTGR